VKAQGSSRQHAQPPSWPRYGFREARAPRVNDIGT